MKRLVASCQKRSLYDAMGRGYLSVGRFLPGSEVEGTLTLYDGLGRAYRTERRSNVIISIEDDTEHSGYQKAVATSEGTLLSWNETTYNDDGSISYTLDDRGNRTDYEYDDAGRQISVTGPMQHVWDPTANSGAGALVDMRPVGENEGDVAATSPAVRPE